ncbi:MAG: sigma 54-interacting transcriptional regulator, partial [Gammaproteobacteria bacterium]
MDWYKEFLKSCPLMVLYLDEAGVIQDISKEMLSKLNFAEDEVIGKKPHDFCTAESREKIFKEYIPNIRKFSELNGAEVHLIDRDGKIVPLISHVRLVRRDDLNAYRTFIFFFDKQFEHLDYFRNLYRSSPAMLFTLDQNFLITDISKRWADKMDQESSNFIGKHITDYILEESILSDLIKEKSRDISLDNVPICFKKHDGSLMEALISAYTERRENSKTSFYFAVKDVTEQNKLTRQLKDTLEENERLKEELQKERDYLREEVRVSLNFGDIVGESASLKKMLSRIEAVAKTSASVLVEGESGTGKELIARVLHQLSDRSNGPLVKVNCAAIPAELFESEFFGHVKGSFTGAYKDRIGKYELADGGTLFLDEIAEIPIDLQSKLLRVLQEGEFDRIGDNQTRKSNVRIVAATNKDIESLISQGLFREDLYYRLGVFPINVPALRERGGDVIQLANHFLAITCKEFGRPLLSLDSTSIELLESYTWPGNIRELKNVIERGVILSSGDKLRLDLAMSDLKISAQS